MVALGDACGLWDCALKVLQFGLPLFLQDEGLSMGGKRNRTRLSHRLAIF